MRTTLPTLLALVAGLACGGDSTSPGQQNSPVGTWQLRSINGRLPSTISTGSPPRIITITGGTLTMSANGSYNEVDSYTAIASGAVRAPAP